MESKEAGGSLPCKNFFFLLAQRIKLTDGLTGEEASSWRQFVENVI